MAVRSRYTIGQRIRIVDMDEEPHYKGREGVITRIDDMGQLHGTWGGLAVVPGWDQFIVLENENQEENENE